MIKKRQFKTTEERHFWDGVQERGAVVRGEVSPPAKEQQVEHINIINNLGEHSAELSGGSLSLLKAPSKALSSSPSKVH